MGTINEPRKQTIEVQRQQLKILLNWLMIIEECDKKIANGEDVDYYKNCKKGAAEGYATTMTALMETVINLSKYSLI